MTWTIRAAAASVGRQDIDLTTAARRLHESPKHLRVESFTRAVAFIQVERGYSVTVSRYQMEVLKRVMENVEDNWWCWNSHLVQKYREVNFPTPQTWVLPQLIGNHLLTLSDWGAINMSLTEELEEEISLTQVGGRINSLRALVSDIRGKMDLH